MLSRRDGIASKQREALGFRQASGTEGGYTPGWHVYMKSKQASA